MMKNRGKIIIQNHEKIEENDSISSGIEGVDEDIWTKILTATDVDNLEVDTLFKLRYGTQKVTPENFKPKRKI